MKTNHKMNSGLPIASHSGGVQSSPIKGIVVGQKEGHRAPCHLDMCQASPNFSLEMSQITLLLHATRTIAMIPDRGQEIEEEMDPLSWNKPTGPGPGPGLAWGLRWLIRALNAAFEVWAVSNGLFPNN
ncbi:hypothetical protein SLA2020_389170 [Shorea laevis]